MIDMSIVLCANLLWVEPRIYSLFEDKWHTLNTFITLCVQPMAKTYKVCLPEGILRARIQLLTNQIIFSGPTPSRVRDVFRHIDHLEKFTATANFVSTRLSSSQVDLGWAAEVCAMRTCVAALTGPFACSNDPRLRALFEEWRYHNLRFLRNLDHPMPHVEVLLPMTQLSIMSQLGVSMYYITMLCTVHDLMIFEETVGIYNSLNIVLDADVAEKIQRMIEMIRVRKKTMHCTLGREGKCSARHDGLDILRHPRGVLC